MSRVEPRDTIAERRRVEGLEQEVARLQAIIAKHDLCHNQQGKVDARAFADGCADEQRKHYGEAPDADRVAKLETTLKECIKQLHNQGLRSYACAMAESVGFRIHEVLEG